MIAFTICQIGIQRKGSIPAQPLYGCCAIGCRAGRKCDYGAFFRVKVIEPDAVSIQIKDTSGGYGGLIDGKTATAQGFLAAGIDGYIFEFCPFICGQQATFIDDCPVSNAAVVDDLVAFVVDGRVLCCCLPADCLCATVQDRTGGCDDGTVRIIFQGLLTFRLDDDIFGGTTGFYSLGTKCTNGGAGSLAATIDVLPDCGRAIRAGQGIASRGFTVVYSGICRNRGGLHRRYVQGDGGSRDSSCHDQHGTIQGSQDSRYEFILLTFLHNSSLSFSPLVYSPSIYSLSIRDYFL